MLKNPFVPLEEYTNGFLETGFFFLFPLFTDSLVDGKLNKNKTIFLGIIAGSYILLYYTFFFLPPGSGIHSIEPFFFSFFYLCVLILYISSIVKGVRFTFRGSPPKKDFFPVYLLFLFLVIMDLSLTFFFPGWKPIFLQYLAPLYTILLSIILLRSLLLEFYREVHSKRKLVPSPRFFTEYGLSKREEEVVTRLCLGKTGEQISRELFISVKTTNAHLHNIYKKCGVNSRFDLIMLIRNYSG